MSPKAIPPNLHIPQSEFTVEVHIIDTTSLISKGPARRFLTPAYKSYSLLHCPAYSFLITHKPTGQRLLFDLGIRKDFNNLVSSTADRIRDWGVSVEKDVAEILPAGDVPLDTITGVIWSHTHFDHTGNMALFPPSVDLIFGPGIKENYFPGHPKNPDSPLLESDYSGRKVQEIDFSSSNLRIGSFEAIDFFNDGSFFLLHTPGHSIGNMSALARTTAGNHSPTFIFMGGDIVHHAGEFRPSTFHPLPVSDDEEALHKGFAVPESILQSSRWWPDAEAAYTKPFVDPTPVVSHDLSAALQSIHSLQQFDADPNVLICFAHDDGLLGPYTEVGLWPNENANDWKRKGWKERCMWNSFKVFEGGTQTI